MNQTIFLAALFISLAYSSNITGQVPNYIPTDSLVGWWSFSGNANDESGNGNNGVINNAYLADDRHDNPTSAYFFDGSQSFIELSNSTSLSRVDTDFSISFWVKLNSYNPSFNAAVISNRSGSSTTGVGSLLSINGQQSPNGVGRVSFGTCCGNSISSSVSLPLQVWKSVVFVYKHNLSEMSVYIDGELNVSGNLNNFDENPNFSHTIGREPNSSPPSPGNAYALHGVLDDIGIWKRALTSQEISDLYFGCQPLVSEQPVDLYVPVSSNALFSVIASDSLPQYQWQTDIGFGFQNLNNAGQYSGVFTSSLLVSNVSLSNDNQKFRCAISYLDCADTTATATLFVDNSTNISLNHSEKIHVRTFPNPSNGIFNIEIENSNGDIEIIVFDAMGRKIFKQNFANIAQSLTRSIDLTSYSKGLYMLHIITNNEVVERRLIKF
jgi:hypothetical protein